MRRHEENFLTRLWDILPQLFPSIHWSVSGKYLVVYDPDKLLREIKNYNITQRSNSVPTPESIDRLFRSYGFIRVRQGALRKMPEFDNLKLKTCVWKHEFLNLASTRDHVVRLALTSLDKFSQRKKQQKDANEAGGSPPVALQDAPTSDAFPDQLREVLSHHMDLGSLQTSFKSELSPYSAGSTQMDAATVPRMLNAPVVCSSSGTSYYRAEDGFYREATDAGDYFTSEANALLDALLAKVIRRKRLQHAQSTQKAPES